VLDYVPGYFRRRQHIRETLACTCGEHIVTAPGPDHSVEGARYGDSFRAFVVTSKCADAIPLYRQAKMIGRLGIPISRSTLTDLFHQAAGQLAPLSKRLLELVAASEVVQADETSLKMLKPNKRGFVWTFLAEILTFFGSFKNQPIGAFAVAAGLVIAAIALASLFRRVLFGLPNPDAPGVSDASLGETWYLALLAGALLWVGLFPSGPKLPGTDTPLFDQGLVNVLAAGISDISSPYTGATPSPTP